MGTKNRRGFSLVETIVAVAILAMLAAGVYGGLAAVAKGAAIAKVKNGALALANERLEIVRGMSYGDIGIVGGAPAGVIPRTETVERGVAYEVTTTVRSIDLPFDGQIGGSPNDLSPADQKLVEVSVTCGICGDEPIRISSRVSPRALETSSGNGALFVQVVDSTGAPIEEADVTVRNVVSSTTVLVEDRTGVDGWLRLVDLPPGVMAYEVSVGKDGYSSDKTYALGDPQNPVPNLPHANVATGTVTQISFTIDLLARLRVSTLKSNCEPVGLDFDLIGEKLIGLDTPKYDERHSTGASGSLGPLSLEWDDYRVSLVGGNRYLSGANPSLPLTLLPDGDAALSLVTAIANPNALLVTVVDAEGLPVADATVSVGGQEKATGMGSVTQTDWSGGPGQEATESGSAVFWGGDGKTDYSSVPGTVRLATVGASYASSGYLESSTFDTGTTTNFIALGWLPASQPVAASAKFQVASAATSSPASWDFVGPDGTATSYYEISGGAVAARHDGDRFVRYRAYLATENPTQTPVVSDFWATYTLDCAPAGQAYFSGLGTGGATVQVSKAGYQTAEVQVPNWSGWTDIEVTLSPQ